ncbi:HAMP domain-containing sensor histidine kinase [Lutibacter sp.]|uniref:sensor histidine kinase n=1 Tax=Lutibacter sp. TaxID=1925666 RepID=UPI001A2CA991|nr:HAMP domain-containing sensor histidine kinase [Lutibacter sp.]MBI9039962.1 HAMP domain-containing histidine kinase [Lutibacter sp.]
MAAIIKEVLQVASSIAKAKDITLTYAILDAIEVFGDVNMLKIVLRNLISNAIKFTNPTGKIEVSAIQNENYIEVSVSDNGIGMTEATRNKLFKIDPINTIIGTAAEKGSGLGLVLCKEFVEKQRGKIWVESKLGRAVFLNLHYL